jgi:hypothetical protein
LNCTEQLRIYLSLASGIFSTLETIIENGVKRDSGGVNISS